MLLLPLFEKSLIQRKYCKFRKKKWMFLLMWKMQPDEETIYQNTFLGYEQHII